jgi:type III secretory pathway component EscV
VGYLPVLIFVVVAIPLLVLAFRATRRSKEQGEHPVPEDAATTQRTEDEFAAAEEYQEQWREEEKKHPRDSIV